MKLVFLGATFSIVYLMRYDKVIRVSYDKESDTFRHIFLIVPCLLLAIIFHHENLLEVRNFYVVRAQVANTHGSTQGQGYGMARLRDGRCTVANVKESDFGSVGERDRLHVLCCATAVELVR